MRAYFVWSPLFLSLLLSDAALAEYWSQCSAKLKTSQCVKSSAFSQLKDLQNSLRNSEQTAEVATASYQGADFKLEKKELSSGILNSSTRELEIQIDPSVKYQEIWGFGASVTESCLSNLEKMPPADRKKLMRQMFSRPDGAGFGYLRIPIGANDFSKGDYTLDDTPGNQPDPQLRHFQAAKLKKFIDFVKEAKAINPDIKILMSPWTAPAWMKDSKKLKGGRILPQYREAYAQYLRKSVQAFQKEGVEVDHMTILNEPLIGEAAESWGFPQAYMPVEDQQKFMKDHLLPVAQSQKKFPKVLVHDHNWDNAMEAKKLVEDPSLRPMVAGIAMHCYGGDLSDQKKTLSEFQPYHGFNSECSATLASKDAAGDFDWWLQTQSLDSLRAGSSGGLGWNLCLDENGGPANNGCPNCRGLVTIHQKEAHKVTLNPEFEALAFASQAVRNGAVRIQSNDTGSSGVSNVAFQNPDGSTVVLLRNPTDKKIRVSLNVRPCQNTIQVDVPAKAASRVTF